MMSPDICSPASQLIFNAAGNRTSVERPGSGTTTSAYNPANQLTSSQNAGATTTYSYSAAGALSEKSDPAGATTYAYNGLDKLTQVTTPSTTVDYAYDALGRRVQRTEGTDTRNIHLSGKSDLPDYWSSAGGSVTWSMGRGPDGLISLTMNPASAPYPCYQLYSPHGDITILADSGGNPIAAARYDSFGNSLMRDSFNYGKFSS